MVQIIIPTSVPSNAGGSASAPPSPPADSAHGADARRKFDDHLKRAGQPTGLKETKRPASRDAAQHTDKPTPDQKPDASAAIGASETQTDSKPPVEEADPQLSTADAQDDAADDQQDQQPSADAVAVAAVTVEQAVAPAVDEVIIQSTDTSDTPTLPAADCEQTGDTPAATNVQLTQAAVAQPTEITADAPSPSTNPGEPKDQATDNLALTKPLARYAPLASALAQEAMQANRQQAAQVPATNGQADKPAEVTAVAVQQVAAATTAPPMVTIVSAAHESLSSNSESERSSRKTQSTDAPTNPVIASVAAAIVQTPVPATPTGQAVESTFAGTPEVKRADSDRDAAAPVDTTPKAPPTGNTDAPTNNRFSISLAARNDFRAEGASNTTEVDRVRFVQRVAKAFQHAEDQGGQIRLRLNPPELGAVKLEITMKAGVMTAKLEAETSAARSMLLDNLPALRERLAEQNVKVEKFDVDLMDRQPGGLPDAMPDGSGQDDRSPRQFFGAKSSEQPAEVAAIGGRIFVDSGQLNVVI